MLLPQGLTYLVRAKLTMFGGYVLSVLVGKWVEHAVVGVDRWDTVLLQLVCRDCH